MKGCSWKVRTTETPWRRWSYSMEHETQVLNKYTKTNRSHSTSTIQVTPIYWEEVSTLLKGQSTQIAIGILRRSITLLCSDSLLTKSIFTQCSSVKCMLVKVRNVLSIVGRSRTPTTEMQQRRSDTSPWQISSITPMYMWYTRAGELIPCTSSNIDLISWICWFEWYHCWRSALHDSNLF